MWVRTKVHSTTLKRLGYDFDSQTLELQFMDGDVYLYQKVPPETVHALMLASSKGEFFNHHIRNFFEYKKARTEN